DGLPDGSRVSRFTVSRSDPPRVDPGSEQILITWLSGGHNGGCLKFGPEGCLYICTGDAAGPNPPDPLNTGQDVSDLLSSILRIDVDATDPGKSYRVPADNPLVGVKDARPEIWAYGFRNPWKMSFDRKTGALWTADVGWELWELVYRVEKGGNYGWSIVEGAQPVKPNGQRGPTPILPPTAAHPHSEAASITGGYVYRGRKFKELIGAYIYGDWATGKIWALRHDGSKVESIRELVTTPLQIISFAEDEAGELLVMDYAGTIHELELNPAPDTSETFPKRLSATGLFNSVETHALAQGVIRYSINAELWSDGAIADRFVAFPGVSGVIKTNEHRWAFPKDAVLGKTLSIPIEQGNAAEPKLRRLETQVLHYDGVTWRGYTYRWNEAQTDAALVRAEGEETVLEIRQTHRGDNRLRRQTWRFHSRAECLRCHNSWAGPPLAFNLLQLQKEHDYTMHQARPAVAEIHSQPAPARTSARFDQLRTLAHVGIIDPELARQKSPRLLNPYESGLPLNERARSWLHVNCAHCHREGAGGSVISHFNFELKPAEMKTFGVTPSQGQFGMKEARVIAPGDPLRSVLYYRINALGPSRMPRLGSGMIDQAGVQLIFDWISSMPIESKGSEEQRAEWLRTQRALVQSLRSDVSSVNSAKTASAKIDRALESTSGALLLLREIDQETIPPSARDRIIEKGTTHPDLLVRALFERFLPEEKRSRKLTPDFKFEEVLDHKGNTDRGRAIFFQTGGVQCYQCHQVRGEGRAFGPDLSAIGKKYSRAQLLEHLAHPSRRIDPEFILYQIETKNDLLHTGFLLKKTADAIHLKAADLSELHIPVTEVQTMQPSQISAMPEGLLQNLTAQEAADLIEYLFGLQ
ncbi:MAG: PQQ-dependent sugar dehydrogenase, partial [Verrucomicrobiota bacterium]